MQSFKTLPAILLIITINTITLGSAAQAEVKLLGYGGYSVEVEVILPGGPGSGPFFGP